MSGGPLQGHRLLGAGAVDWTQASLNAVPLLCRHADMATQTTGLDLAMSLGFPLMLWSRAATHTDCAEFYERAEDLLRRTGTARELIAQVCYLRAYSATRRDDPKPLGPVTSPSSATHPRLLTRQWARPKPNRLGAGPTVEQAETYASNTSRTSCSCSAWCRFAEPTAGDDECGREIRRSRSP